MSFLIYVIIYLTSVYPSLFNAQIHCGTDTRVGRLPHRLNCLSLSPPTLDVQGRPPRRSPSSHSISTPNIASSKDFHSNGGKRRWSPLVRRGGDDDDDYAPSVQSSKMTSVSSVLSAVSTEKIRNRSVMEF